MRFFEFKDDPLDQFALMLNNFIGRYRSKGSPGTMNWKSISSLAGKVGFEILTGDEKQAYTNFASLWDTDKNFRARIEPMVKNFSGKGIQLNVPGAADAEEPEQGGETSQDAVDKTAASAAAGQLAQSQATPQV